MTAQSRGYADPILAGVALGILLFLTIVLVGRGLGASGAFATASAAAAHAVAPGRTAAHPYLADYVPTGRAGLLGDWTVIELLAVAAGAWLSARLARRPPAPLTSIAGESSRTRLAQALVGGCLMGAGARLAHGCTSGLGLTGGALLATGAWLFIPVAFGSAFLVAFLQRRLTRAAR
jgi:hypothetical protein